MRTGQRAVAASYSLSSAAERAIAEIVNYTDATFGEQQTVAYLAGLAQSFELIVQYPGIGVAVYEFGAGLRRFRYQSHHVYYSALDEGLLIRHIIHVRRKVRRDLFDT